MDTTKELLEFLHARIIALETENEKLQSIINILIINKHGKSII
jgi:hypothetical protein